MNEDTAAWRQCGLRLENLVRHAQQELVLVAPFIKAVPFRRLLALAADSIPVTVVTRWKPEEVALGVSDLEIWETVKERASTELRLCSALHAKYYRADQSCLVGSSNLTARALGWASSSNTELLLPIPAANEHIVGFESQLLESSSPVDDSVVDFIRDAAAQLQISRPSPSSAEELAEEASATPACRAGDWVPLLRHPEELYSFYEGDCDSMTGPARAAAATDLTALDVPRGLSGAQFGGDVGAQMLQSAVVAAVDAYLVESQRFGAVADFLFDQLNKRGVAPTDRDAAWQTLMRWLLFFLPGRYVHSVPHYSEIMVRRTEEADT